MLPNYFSRKVYIFKNNESNVQVDILNIWLSRICLKHDEMTFMMFSSFKEYEEEENQPWENIWSHEMYTQNQNQTLSFE